VLHPAGAAVRRAVVAQRRPLARDPRPQRVADTAMQRTQLVVVQPARRTQRMDARAPEGFVGVDVPDAGEAALVEDRRLHGRAPAGEGLGEASCRERRSQRLAAKAGVEVRLDLVRLGQEPCAEAADVAVDNVRSVF
jgi:hypothetical protein